MQHIETVTLSASQSSITFSDIPQDFTDLMITLSARSDTGSSQDNINMRPNGLTTNGQLRALEGSGSGVSTFVQTTLIGGVATGDTATANTFGNSNTYISNYTANQIKAYGSDAVNETNATGVLMYLVAGLWSDNSAITSLEFLPNAGSNFLALSTFSLYGITAGSDGTTTVS